MRGKPEYAHSGFVKHAPAEEKLVAIAQQDRNACDVAASSRERLAKTAEQLGVAIEWRLYAGRAASPRALIGRLP
jgi:hypothetical protein